MSNINKLFDSKKLLVIYFCYTFHNICIQTNAVASKSDIAVFGVMLSPIKIQVRKVNDIMPTPNAMNLPGHSKPSKCTTTFFVANINI